MRFLRSIVSLSLAVLVGGWAFVAHAEPVFPEPTSYVMDVADIMTPEQESSLANEIYTYQTSSTHQIAVLTMPDLGGLTPSDYAQKLWEKWGIGQAGRDNGVLLLVAVAEDRIRIQTGRGVEDVLPDILAGNIIRDDMRPLYNTDKRGESVIVGVHKIMEALETAPAAETVYTNEVPTKAAPERLYIDPGLLIAIGMFVIMGFIYGLAIYLDKKQGLKPSYKSTYWDNKDNSTTTTSSSSKSSSSNDDWSSGSGGGSSYSGYGGGRSGGGGADG